ncbi:centromere protein Q isoform X3 [Strigops habroptila]|uniref:centromere protein Q isoform X3 n=1 Tax=Strigops habroptila TaxID=2489341 RepID=UPI0011CFB4AA|nr:centromere protein Q isoform X3 [Strigops habroptila]
MTDPGPGGPPLPAVHPVAGTRSPRGTALAREAARRMRTEHRPPCGRRERAVRGQNGLITARRWSAGTAGASKMGKTAGRGSAKKPLKSQSQERPSSKKKGTDTEGRKQGQKRKQVTQSVKRKAKEDSDYSPSGGKGSLKKMKLTNAKIGSWKTLSESSRQFLETVMDSIILSVLCQQRERKGDVQEHLNLVKERALRCFQTLKVPPGKLGNLKNVLSLQMAEKKKLKTNEESLVQLQVFQENGSGALHLPELPKCSLQAPTLQEEILKMKNQKGLLKDMNTIQQSADLKNFLTLIEKTYEKVDFL